MSEVYGEILDFMMRRPKYFQKRNDYGIQIFDENISVIYVSLLNPIGSVKKVSNNFQTLFGYTQKQCINRSINEFLPSQIQKRHDDLLQNFIQRFICPIYMRMRLDQILNNDFGITCLITKLLYQDREYITYNKNGKIKEISEKAFKYLFLTYTQLNKGIKYIQKCPLGNVNQIQLFLSSKKWNIIFFNVKRHI
ncbi:hypothetical protein IMG5_054990 [Ichthyophthirius multifiliis]|uniref:PAS domain-containing protein n=1 Tax=Ichthyophthirius multifiliis TaxID=5932 RepID=G0QN28_ICHMU|nr:hypothetical protein IMG5_054990 [Ichthyophthirius multifiliis]EGR33357.1 hypothetical protein IMG5_054990 [Ichthyophthirius multifiliis]|eukprot:XP_004037343.1 hypothetical protein IMG5_054990 [Ichthyophthirius multifiliis]